MEDQIINPPALESTPMKLKLKDEIIRVDPRMSEEIKDIKRIVKERCGKKVSDRAITSLFIRYDNWEREKIQIINYLIANHVE